MVVVTQYNNTINTQNIKRREKKIIQYNTKNGKR